MLSSDYSRMIEGTINKLRRKGWAKGVPISFVAGIVGTYHESTTFHSLALAVCKAWAERKWMGGIDPDRVTATEIRDWRSRNYLDPDYSSLEQRVLAHLIATPQDLKGLTMNTKPYATVEQLRLKAAEANERVRVTTAQLKNANALLDQRERLVTESQQIVSSYQDTLATQQNQATTLTAELAARELADAKELFAAINKTGTAEQQADIAKFRGTLAKPIVHLIGAVGSNTIRVTGGNIELVWCIGTPGEVVTRGFPSVEEAARWARGRNISGHSPQTYAAVYDSQTYPKTTYP